MKRNSKIVRLLALILVTLLIVAACTTQETPSAPDDNNQTTTDQAGTQDTATADDPDVSGERRALTIGYQSATNPQDENWWPTAFIEELQSVLNMDIELVTYSIDRLNLALASRDLTDLLRVNQIQAATVLDGNMAAAFDPFLDNRGSNINAEQFQIRNNIIRRFQSNNDGQLYFVTPNVGEENKYGGVDIWNGYLVRWDRYLEIGAPDIGTDEDFVGILNQMVELEPVTDDGLPVYAMGIHNDWGLWAWNMMQFSNRGYQNTGGGWIYAASYVTGELVNNYLDLERGPFWYNMRFFNALWNLDLLDPDSFIMTSEEVNEKAGRGQYVSGISTWFTGRLRENMAAIDPNTLAGIVAVPAVGQGGWYGGNHIAGWGDALVFMSADGNVETAVDFTNFMHSPDAARLHYSGVQGVYWDYDASGKPVVTDRYIELREGGGDPWRQVGIASMNHNIGESAFGMHPDGYYFDLFAADFDAKIASLNPLQVNFSEHFGVRWPSEHHLNMVNAGRAFNQSDNLITAINIGIGEIPSNIARIDSQIDEIAFRAIPGFVMAESEDEFLELQEAFLNDIRAAGAQESNDFWMPMWNEILEYVLAAAGR